MFEKTNPVLVEVVEGVGYDVAFPELGVVDPGVVDESSTALFFGGLKASGVGVRVGLELALDSLMGMLDAIRR